jgi:hypothetical protein
MTRFKRLEDLIKVFANEYCIPGGIVIILGYYSEYIKGLFEFLNCETIFVFDTTGGDINCDYSDLPFENDSCDLIINFSNESNLFHLLKPNCKMLMKGEILNGIEYYSIGDTTFTVL